VNPVEATFLESVAVFLGIIGCLEIGYRVGRQSRKRHPDSAHEGISVFEASVFGLLGLLLALSFSGGTSRLDAKRQLTITEANAIANAYQLLDKVPVNRQPALRELFKDYMDERLKMDDNLANNIRVRQEAEHMRKIRAAIWSEVISGTRDDPDTARLLIPAIHEMSNIGTARSIVMRTRLPRLIFDLLIGVALASGLFAGYAVAKRNVRSWLHAIVYALVISTTIYVILDLDDPLRGAIRMDPDRALQRLRDSL
jgi:hypothetical protein